MVGQINGTKNPAKRIDKSLQKLLARTGRGADKVSNKTMARRKKIKHFKMRVNAFNSSLALNVNQLVTHCKRTDTLAEGLNATDT